MCNLTSKTQPSKNPLKFFDAQKNKVNFSTREKFEKTLTKNEKSLIILTKHSQQTVRKKSMNASKQKNSKSTFIFQNKNNALGAFFEFLEQLMMDAL